jgi:hypothetical protein
MSSALQLLPLHRHTRRLHHQCDSIFHRLTVNITRPVRRSISTGGLSAEVHCGTSYRHALVVVLPRTTSVVLSSLHWRKESIMLSFCIDNYLYLELIGCAFVPRMTASDTTETVIEDGVVVEGTGIEKG